MLIKFMIVGAVALSLENLLVYLLMDVEISYYLVRLLTLLIILTFSYIANSMCTFKAKLVLTHFISYSMGVSVSAMISYIVSLGCFYVLFEEDYPLFSTNIGAGFAFIINYLFQKKITFKK